MGELAVVGGRRLEGEIVVSGAKNSVLKLMAASLLAPGVHRITNVPEITDVTYMGQLLEHLGVEVKTPHSGVRELLVPENPRPEAPYSIVERMRASTAVLGPLLARMGRVSVSLPGGDDFGPRPIDMHLKGLEALGARFETSHGDVLGHSDGLVGTRVFLEFPSVGATENVLMAASLAKGVTTLENAAREPEIEDLADYLTKMGAKIEGAGSSSVTVVGVERLNPAEHSAVPDRVEAATLLCAVGAAGGDIFLRDARADHLEMLLSKFRDMGALIEQRSEGIGVSVPTRLKSVDIATLPYPGVATDFMPMLVALLCTADGVGIVTENVFSGRFRYVDELVRMGADIRTDSHHAVVRGVERLSSAPVRCHDIRAGAAMLVAALGAQGESRISETEHISRGYERLAERLRGLGADVHEVE